MTLPFSVVLAVSLLASPAGDAEPIAGKVATQAGIAIEHAEITVLPGEHERVFSSADGGFSISGCEPGCSLWVRHPRFEEQVLDIVDPTQPLAIVLTAKQEVFEHIDVTASRVGDSLAPTSVAASVIETDDRTLLPTTLTELVSSTAGVAENGQGGLFQVYSIRGVSRHRVMTLIEGIPLTSERRAGVAASFIDPLLLGSAEVVRGPASTYYGSGALGGVVQAFVQRFDQPRVDIGYSAFGNQTYQLFGTGRRDQETEHPWSVAIAHRRQEDDEAADGSLQNSHFEQTSAVLTKEWNLGTKSYELLLVPSVGRDIGKPNIDFPGREINYPRENHVLAELNFSSDGPWTSSIFVHPNELETTEDRNGARRSVVENSSLNFGARAQRPIAAGRGLIGIDYWARRNVDAVEQRFSSDGSSTTTKTLDDGALDEIAVLASTNWDWSRARFQAGGRATWQRQSQAATPASDDSSFNGFLGAVVPIGASFELTANVGTGLRFPTLSERFFSGTTGRGEVIGNPDLEAESSVALDTGLRWFSRRHHLSTQVFHQEISDYIERVEVAPGLLTFVNLTSGTITGLEIEGHHSLAERWQLAWTGQLVDGEADDGSPLSDIPTDRLRSQLTYSRASWRVRMEGEYRRAKTDPGSGEQELSASTVFRTSVRYQVDPRWAVDLTIENLTDELYYSSADNRTSPSAGRSVGLGLTWSPRENASKPTVPRH